MDRQIEATTTLRSPLEVLREVLSASPGRVLADPGTLPDATARTFHTVLSAKLAAAGSVEQEVLVHLGAIERASSDVVLSIAWEPTSHDLLFPSFTGSLTIVRNVGHGTTMTVSGTYRVPLGPVGRFGDVVVGRRAARQSLDDLVRRLATRLDGEADRRRRSSIQSPKPYNVDLREFGTVER